MLLTSGFLFAPSTHAASSHFSVSPIANWACLAFPPATPALAVFVLCFLSTRTNWVTRDSCHYSISHVFVGEVSPFGLYYFKVRNIVVERVVVYVMHHFGLKKVATDGPLHHYPVIENPPVLVGVRVAWEVLKLIFVFSNATHTPLANSRGLASTPALSKLAPELQETRTTKRLACQVGPTLDLGRALCALKDCFWFHGASIAQSRYGSKQQAEYLTMNREPAHRPAIQVGLWGGV